MDEALSAFLAESSENLARLELDLVELEQDPADAARIASAFRAIHTIKGTCGFFGFPRLERLTHGAEEVLMLLRDGKLAMSLECISLLLQLIDAVRAMLGEIARARSDGEDDYADLLAAFAALAAGAGNGTTNATAKPASGVPVAGVSAGPNPARGASPEGERGALLDSSVRVDVALLDHLLNTIGELVLARNQLQRHAHAVHDPRLSRMAQRIDTITAELQDGLMRTRMQPVGTLWGSFPRLVRDLEQQTGHRLRLLREGGETELDRSLLQAIKDPLTHLLRNAADHGIEAPEVRVARGKPEAGTITLRAFHDGDNVIIEMQDDGAGMDAAAIARRAVERGLVDAAQAARMSESDAIALLFLPGFSTAGQVTSVSGRGVGLDVVKTNIEDIGGRIEVESTPGAGSCFRLRIPLTLAIIPALIVTCASERLVVPQSGIREILLIDGEDVPQRIEQVSGAMVCRLRGELLSLIDLRLELGLGARPADSGIYVLVMDVDGRRYGLVVDLVHDTEEIVVKPLGRFLKAIGLFSGASIMGDGRIALIVDARALAQRVCAVADTAPAQKETEQVAADESVRLLLFRAGVDAGRIAMPVNRVVRLEEVPAAALERSGGIDVVQYRGGILPLVHLRQLLGLPPVPPVDDLLRVVVYGTDHGHVGLVVSDILDIVEEQISALQRQDEAEALMGSAVVEGVVTDFLDVERMLAPLASRFHRAPAPVEFPDVHRG